MFIFIYMQLVCWFTSIKKKTFAVPAKTLTMRSSLHFYKPEKALGIKSNTFYCLSIKY